MKRRFGAVLVWLGLAYYQGNGSPEGVVRARPGALYWEHREMWHLGRFWVKEVGSGLLGWSERSMLQVPSWFKP